MTFCATTEILRNVPGWIGQAAAAALIATVVLVCGCGSGSGPTNTIMTESGPVRGVNAGAVEEYLGIPYAAAPVGERRWLPPRAHGPWSGVLEAFDFGSECTQPGSSPGETAGSEDCLFLNVYRPHRRSREHQPRTLPVMVWIHGGGLTILNGNFDVPPALLEDGNVIVVSLNYRLGVLGFFAHPALDAEGHPNADYGLMDQQFALQWVRRNIAAFGGDPQRITIFGTSAGALSVYSHLASPTAGGLFQRAIAQSGSYEGLVSYERSIVPLSEAEATGMAFADMFGCSTSSCLRAIPAAELVAVEPNNSYPILDGAVLTQTPGAAFADGQFNRVPVIAGTSHDDYRFVVAIDYDFGSGPLTPAGYPAAVARMLGLPLDEPFVSTVLDQYPLSNYGDSAPIALGAAGTDRGFACPALSGNLSLAQWVPTYAYEFHDEHAPSFFDRPVSFPLGAYHSAEVLYLLNTDRLNTEQLQLSSAWVRYWTNFAATGDPNSPGVPDWPLFDAAVEAVQSMQPPAPVSESGFATDHMCSFWLPLTDAQ
jgi:para-nitrobenzyl esterase